VKIAVRGRLFCEQKAVVGLELAEAMRPSSFVKKFTNAMVFATKHKTHPDENTGPFLGGRFVNRIPKPKNLD
jgi:hypothetical protein